MSGPPLAGESDGEYGPRTAVVEKIIDRAGRLTAQEARALDAAWGAVGHTAWHAARVAAYAAWDAARCDTRFDTVDAAEVAASDARAAVGDAAFAVEIAAVNAAFAAAVAHLEGEHGLTREHLEALAGLWRQVINDVDPLAATGGDDG